MLDAPQLLSAAPRVRTRHSAALLGLVLLIGLTLRLPAFARPMLSDDEAIYATTADAMRRGAALYRDVVDHKPPAIYDVYLASSLVLGPYDTHGAHVLVACAVLLCAVALARSARRLYDDEGTALAAALLWVVFSTTMLDYDALAANCELFLVSAQAAAFAWLVGGDRDRRIGLAAWLGAGVLTGLSVTFKYQGATFALVLAVAVILEWWSGRRRVAGALGSLAVAGAGCLVVPAFYAARMWHQGNLEAARYWFEFNLSYIAAGPSGWEALWRGLGRTALVGGLGAILLYSLGLYGGWQVVRSLRSLRAGRRPMEPGLERRLLALTWLAAAGVSAAAGGRFFGHYFHHVTPALCLLAARPLVSVWRERPSWRPVLAAIIVVPATAALACATVLRAEVIAQTDPEPRYDGVVAELRRVSRETDRVFVWGNTPQLYVLALRPMGTRFSFCNYMTGVSPGTRTETGEGDADRNRLRDAWPMLFADLEARRPRWIVDASAAGWDGYAAFPVSRYPPLHSYVLGHYHVRSRVDGVTVYERGRQ
jgi:hypothetical protein